MLQRMAHLDQRARNVIHPLQGKARDHQIDAARRGSRQAGAMVLPGRGRSSVPPVQGWSPRSGLDGEFALQLAVLGLVLLFTGAGAWSVDAWLHPHRVAASEAGADARRGIDPGLTAAVSQPRARSGSNAAISVSATITA